MKKFGRQWVKQHLVSSLFVLVFAFAFAVADTARARPRDDCHSRCGDLEIPYPFGTEEGCYYNDRFLLTCHGKSNTTFFGQTKVKVLHVSSNSEIRLQLPWSFDCFNASNNSTEYFADDFWLSAFPLSSKKNKLIGIGCGNYAYLEGRQGEVYQTGCQSTCLLYQGTEGEEGRRGRARPQTSPPSLVNGSCSGIGCCKADIPGGIKYFRPISYGLGVNRTGYPCINSFVVEYGQYNFSTKDLQTPSHPKASPVIFDWFIGDLTCGQAGNSALCSINSDCIDFDHGPGYTCKCRRGFEGNPYDPKGCQDIDECKRHTHNCAKLEFCHNKEGGFDCKCPKGFEGDPRRECVPKRQQWAIIILGIAVGLLVILLGLCCLNQELRHRKHTKLREKFFKQNGGILLRRRLSDTRSSREDVKIFTEEDIKRATNNYHESGILGEGGQGTVYKGILSDNREVAIKKARIGDHSQVEHFVNEIIVLSQINHRHVVKLLGCCLETETPLLIYEYVRNGSLFDHLHASKFGSFLQWTDRLRIALETAETLSYLHSSASIPIIHRDVKSANILLDDNLSTKVSDFGASKLIPVDREQLTTLVQGTLGYLDPEYLHSSMLNEKSDVYSFGVVLMELLRHCALDVRSGI